MIEDALPISVSTGQNKSAREVFSINAQKLREKSELSKEERYKERQTRKRKIKSHLKHKELQQKEKKRDQGLAMHLDNFEARQIKKNKDKKDSNSNKKTAASIDDKKPSSKNEMKSSKFFSKMQEVAKDDATRKEQKKLNKEKGAYNRNFQPAQHNNESTKRFKL